jgi:serine/threonine-protein kinase
MQPVDRRLVPLREALVGQVLRGSGGTNYYLRERIGEGGQGWVFKANWDEPGGIVVIVKVLRPDTLQGDSLARFRREAEVLRLLSQQARPNPYIVRFFDHAVAQIRMNEGDNVALPFTVLEYVQGPALDHVLQKQRGRGMSVERVRRLARQTVHALELVHSEKVVHRDLKPSNILIATEGESEVAKITDFGIVKRRDMNLHRTTALAGASLGYAPPEQYEQGNDRVSPKTDIFSLAAIVHEMLAGQMAFPFVERENPLLIVTRILNGPRPELLRVRNQLAPELAARVDVIRQIDAHFGRALSADPTDRPESVTEFWGLLEPLLREVASLGADARPSMLPFAHTASPRPTDPPPNPSATQRSVQGPVQPPAVRVNPVARTPLPPRQRTSDPGNPSAWTWHVVSRPIQEKLVFSASFSAAGESIVAAGPSGLAQWVRGGWTAFALPVSIDTRAVRGVKFTVEGDIVLFGEQSLAARLTARGTHEMWTFPVRDLSLRAAHVQGDAVVFVGERPVYGSTAGDTIGALAQRAAGCAPHVVDVLYVKRLNGVTRLANGPIVACGDRGALARLEGGAVALMGSVCRGHLTAIEALADGGAVTVGAGGHALYVSPRLDAQLEAVQTTRDLSALTVGADGAVWAGAAQARLLRREGGSWVRMSGDLGITPRIVAIWAGDPLVRAVCDDGAVLEGRAA